MFFLLWPLGASLYIYLVSPKFINTRFCNFKILLQSRLRRIRRGCKFVPLCIPRQKRITQTHLKDVQSMFYHHSTFCKAGRKSTLYKYRLQDKKDHLVALTVEKRLKWGYKFKYLTSKLHFSSISCSKLVLRTTVTSLDKVWWCQAAGEACPSFAPRDEGEEIRMSVTQDVSCPILIQGFFSLKWFSCLAESSMRLTLSLMHS